ncbi:ATP-binding protein [Cryobacterium fucosi]|uniref:ATP-binding protein n=1 Tax=Cryobacterium fucosi TaxID=1259157 RepID=UPI003B96B257
MLRHGVSTKKPGAHGRGLGLALVRQTVNRLVGTLTIGRRRGAVFTVTLPGLSIPASGRATLGAETSRA